MGIHETCGENEVFVGNIPTGVDRSDLTEVKHRIGNIAYDIHGDELPASEMRPLFVEKSSFDLYNTIMQAKVEAIRRGWQ